MIKSSKAIINKYFLRLVRKAITVATLKIDGLIRTSIFSIGNPDSKNIKITIDVININMLMINFLDLFKLFLPNMSPNHNEY